MDHFGRTDRADFNGDGFPDLLDYEQIDFPAIGTNSGKGTNGGGSLFYTESVNELYADVYQCQRAAVLRHPSHSPK